MSSESVGSIEASLAHVRDVVMGVAQGDLSREAAVEHPDTHPLGALAQGVNSMIEALRAARGEADSRLSELEDNIRTIQAQREAIRELSTPIIEVWRGVLCVPVVGVMDSVRAAEITDELLQAIVDRGTQYVIVDITGIEVMDTNTTDHFVRLAKSVTLLGAECVISGLNPNVARTVVEMGVDISTVRSHRSLRQALRWYVDGHVGTGAHKPASTRAL